MKLAGSVALLAICGAASAAPGLFSSRRGMSLFRRWDYDVCLNDCTLSGIPMPDKDNFQLPLENNWSEQCPPIYIGDWDAPLATSRVCLDFTGSNMRFNVSSFPGYTTKSATVTWKLMGNMLDPADWSSPPPTATLTCVPADTGDLFICELPFSDILGLSPSTSIKNLLAGMCPNGDREGMGFYFEFSGEVESSDSTVLPFQQQFPCTTRDSNRQCTAWDTSYNYIEMSYRCTNCSAAPCPPPTTSCGLGTAFGYQAPVGGKTKSFTLDTLSGKGCNRWGWYETPTLADLQAGIGGPLYVGAGGNDISKAVNVGHWAAAADSTGKVTVTYTTNSPYAISQVHIDLACLPIDKCAPGSYTYGVDTLSDLSTWHNPTPLQYPSCSGSSVPALIIHAAIDTLTTATTCAAPLAT